MNVGHTDLAWSACNKTETATVYIVDADTFTRNALESLVTFAGWQVKTAASAEEFMAFPRAVTPSCLLVDLNLPGLSGLELQQLIVDRSDLQVIFMSRNANIQATVQAVKAGAFEFLTKPFPDEVLLGTVRQAMEHSRAEVGQLERTRTLQQRYQSLSVREREVMKLVVSGRLNKQVGAELGISEITVKAHRGRVMRKMQAHSLPELVNMSAHLQLRAPVDSAEMHARNRFDSSYRVSQLAGTYRPAVRSHESPSLYQSSLGAH